MLVNPLANADAGSVELAHDVVRRQYQLHPELLERFGEAGKNRCFQDTCFHIGYLSESVSQDSPEVFLRYTQWAKTLLQGYGVPVTDLAANLQLVRDAVAAKQELEQRAKAVAFLDMAVARLPMMSANPASLFTEDKPLHRQARLYLDYLLQLRKREALELITGLLEKNVPVRDIYLQVFQTAQREVGRLWQLRKISVAQEHYVSAATQFVMSQLYSNIFSRASNGKTFVATCVGDELHEIGLRMVADFLEMEGWDTLFLGANVPTADIVATAADAGANSVGLSATLPFHARRVTEITAALRADSRLSKTFIIVGGYAFADGGANWKTTGADAFAEDASGAIAILSRQTSEY